MHWFPAFCVASICAGVTKIVFGWGEYHGVYGVAVVALSVILLWAWKQGWFHSLK